MKNFPAVFVAVFLVAGAGVTILQMRDSGEDTAIALAVTVPALSLKAQKGEGAFNATCAECHGKNAAGSDKGPALVHDIYNPGHHADEAFRRAVRLGVRRHHWPFGDMPRQEHVRPSEIEAIIAYVRELQAANGIVYRPHQM